MPKVAKFHGHILDVQNLLLQNPQPYRLADALQQHRYPAFLLRWPPLIGLLHLWNHMIHPRNRMVRKYFHLHLRQLPAGARVLDAGFGDGQHLFAAVRRFHHLHFTGVDKHEQHLRFAKQYFAYAAQKQHPQLLCTNIETMNFSGHFDLALCCGTLQYLKDDLAGLKSLCQALKPRCRLLLYVPVNNRSVFPWYRWLQRHLGHYDEKQNKRRGYTPQALREKCRAAGFELCSTHMTNGLAGIMANEWYNTWLMLAGNAGRFSWLMLPLLFLLVLPALPLQWLDDILPKEKGNGMLLLLQKS